jgi:hypothetical protein
VYYVYTGIAEYRKFLKSKEKFLETEILKVKQYKNYEQYAAVGIKILNHASPVDIFVNSNYIRKKTKANIDASEHIDVTTSKRLKNVFDDEGSLKGIADFFNFFGALFFVLVGNATLKGIQYIRFYKRLKYLILAIANRLLHLEIFFCLLFGFFYFLVRINGIEFNPTEIKILGLYILYLVLLIIFLYLSGLLISVFTLSRKKTALILSVLYWLSICFILPDVSNKYTIRQSDDIQPVEELELEKLITLMEMEGKAIEYFEKNKNLEHKKKVEIARKMVDGWMKGGFQKNEKMEDENLNHVKRILNTTEKRSLLLPTIFFRFLSREITSNAYFKYVKFEEYTRELRTKFMGYYLKKRYSPGGNVTQTINAYGFTVV